MLLNLSTILCVDKSVCHVLNDSYLFRYSFIYQLCVEAVLAPKDYDLESIQ